jgi:acetyltransferase-like isoleucine patch superfamily enzyme
VSKRGRDQFQKVELLIQILISLIKIIPMGLRKWIWASISSSESKIALVIRYAIVKASVKSCGNVVYIGTNVTIRGWSELCLGSNISIHSACYLDATGGIQIENDVSIAHQSSILSTNHTYSDSSLPIRDNPVTLASVKINHDVWIGCGCRILAGITIGSRCIVAAGAVVTKDIKPGLIVGGIPATPIKTISNPYSPHNQ